MMKTSEIVDYLRGLADATTEVACSGDACRVAKARLAMQAVMLLEACDRLEAQENETEQLHQRLVRQASWFEQFEARREPKSWPLLEDDDPGMGL